MFFVLLILPAAFVVWTTVTSGPRAGAAMALAFAFGLPCWSYLDVGAVRLDPRLAVALLGIGGILLHPATSYQLRFVAADFVIVALVAAQITSELLTDAKLTTTLDLALQWLIPYLFGRLAWRSAADGECILPGVVTASVVLSLWAAIESIARVNPVGMLFGYEGSLQSMHDLRWGMRRAEANLTHPIFFGLQLVLLFPFALAAAKRARDGDGPRWWRWTPWIVGLGACFTMSRGPQLGIMITLLTAVVLLVPRYRLLVLVPAACVTAFSLLAPDTVVELMQRWSGETVQTRILIKGEWVTYSGTAHRLLQLRVYSEAVRHAEWFGYGSAALHSQEMTIPFVEEHLRQMFFSIDNHYLQFVLQSGFVGVALFITLCGLGIFYAASGVAHGSQQQRYFAGGLAGSLLALTLLMSSVWLGPDYRFVLLTSLGLAGGLRLSCFPQKLAEPVPTVRLNLSPGHPRFSLPVGR